MIQTQTFLRVADNTGARYIMCIRVLRGSNARIGDSIIAVVKDAIPNGKIKKSEIVRALIVRTLSSLRRKDGTTLRFGENAAIILNKNKNPRGTRIFGPVAREIRKAGYQKILSLAFFVI
uniref:Large ribosomal subunit protein uL14c n=1 Tax=Prototheca stagnorum TaxID=215448 RepID=A0A2Z6BEM5_9CHLO|nr:ribosomal protein l14 [Prototheca stagnorum]BBD20178.1 ribosomal protein l14 [Prototheca stagnorum]